MKIKLLMAAVASVFCGVASANVVANGDFTAGGSNWDVRSGSVTFGGEAALATVGAFDQTLSLAQDTSYKLTFSSVGAGYVDLADLDYALSPTLGGAGTTNVINFSNGSNYTFYFTTDHSQPYIYTKLKFGSTAAFATFDNVSVTAVPEPETYAMMLAGLGAIGFMARRRQVK